MADEPVIEFRDVSFAYNGAPAVEGVNLSIATRQSVCIIGPNGGGKTTLLKLILGLLEPDRGEVRVFGGPPRAARLRMGYMPQYVQHDPQFPATVMDIVLMGRLGRRACGDGSAGTAAPTAAPPKRPWPRSAWKASPDAASPPSPAASASGRSSPGRSAANRSFSSSTSRRPTSTPWPSRGSSKSSREINRRMTVVVVSHDLGFVSNLVESVVCVNRRAVLHPTSAVSGQLIHEIYGGEVRMVRHSDVVCRREHVDG